MELNANDYYAPELKELCGSFMSLFGCTRCWSMQISSSGSFNIVTSDVALLQKYFDGKNYLFDPHVIDPKSLDAGLFVWSNLDGLNELLGASEGMSIITHSLNKSHIYCFPSTLKRSELYTKVIRNMVVCSLWQRALPQKTKGLFAACEDYEIDMLQLKGSSFYNTSDAKDSLGMISFKEHP